MNGKRQTTGVILAGGLARRMGGRDKGLLAFEGRPLIRHVIDALRPQVERLIVNANRNLESYARFGLPVVEDEVEGFQGPLAGILSAMHQAATPWLLVVPCDAPHPPPDLRERLMEAAQKRNALIAVAHDGVRLQPVHALISTALAADLEQWLASGGRKIDRWYARHPMAVVDFSDRPEAFLNLNTPEERQRLEKQRSAG